MGLEPMTNRLKVCCYYHLSYTPFVNVLGRSRTYNVLSHGRLEVCSSIHCGTRTYVVIDNPQLPKGLCKYKLIEFNELLVIDNPQLPKGLMKLKLKFSQVSQSIT